jgi:hypothetical protein
MYRGPIGISHRTIKKILSELEIKDESKIGWNFVKFYLEEIGARPFEKPYVKQLCKLLDKLSLSQKFLSSIYNTTDSIIVPRSYITNFTAILNDNLSKPINDFSLICDDPKTESVQKVKSNADKIPGIPSSKKKVTKKKVEEPQIPKELVACDTELPKHTPESNRLKDSFLSNAITRTYKWIHEFIFGKFFLSKKNLPASSDDSLFFYNIAESLAIEIGLFHDLLQVYTGVRNKLIADLEKTIETIEQKLKQYKPDGKSKYPLEKKISFDVKYIPNQFKKNIEKIVTILTQIENNASKGKITKENIKSYLESGFLGRVQDISIPQAKKVLDDIKSINSSLTNKELDKISKATAINFKELTTNIVFLQPVSTILPGKDSEYTKEFREIISYFRKLKIDLSIAFEIIFRLSLEMPNLSKLTIHKKLLDEFFRISLPVNVNTILDKLPNSQVEKATLVRSSFLLRKELFQLIGMKILSMKPLNLVLSIPIKKQDEANYLFKFNPLELPQTAIDQLKDKFLLKENSEGSTIVIGKEYYYQSYSSEKPTNLTSLLISDAFRKTMELIENPLKIISKIGLKIHSGMPNLKDQLIESYHYITEKLIL